MDALGFAARLGNDVVAIGLGLVARALLIGAGALHIVEGVYHRGGRVDALQLHLGEQDAGLLGVQPLLQQRAGLVRHLLAAVGHRRLDLGVEITSRSAPSAAMRSDSLGFC